MGRAIDATGDPVQAAESQPRSGGLVAARAGRQEGLRRSGCARRSSASRTSSGSSGGPAACSSSTARRRPGAGRRRRYRLPRAGVTTGTFLNGLIHIGPEQHPAGRAGEPPSRELAESLKSFGFEWGRLKTGTPPRLDRDEHRLRRAGRRGRFHVERGDDPPVPFSFLTRQIDRAADRLLSAAHQRAGARSGAGEHRSIAAVQRPDPGHRPALLPVARRQDRALPGQGAAPDLPRARRARRARDLRQRLLDGLPRDVQAELVHALPVSRTRCCCGPATRSSTTSSSRPS